MNTHYPTTQFNSSEIAEKLNTPLLQEVISKRAGRGNTTLSYVRGDIIADQMNAIFGPLGWDLQASVPVIDHWEGEKEIGNDREKKKVNMHTVQVMTQMTLRVKARSANDSDTIFRQTGIGYGEIESTKNRKEVVGMALKGAETDGLKRCATLLGKAMGMFLSGAGIQDELEYAHNGKKVDIDKAKKMRQDRLASERGTKSQAPEPERKTNANANQEGANSGRAQNTQNAGNEDRSRSSNVDAHNNNQNNESREPEKKPVIQEKSQSNGNSNAPEDKGGQAVNKDEGRKSQGFDMNQLPVTSDDQVNYSKEILSRVGEFNQKSDKEKFLKTHYNTIKNLDSKYRRRLIERVQEQDIDFEALGAN
jgi:recombination DNA repair RAD52 pathway protein